MKSSVIVSKPKESLMQHSPESLQPSTGPLALPTILALCPPFITAGVFNGTSSDPQHSYSSCGSEILRRTEKELKESEAGRASRSLGAERLRLEPHDLAWLSKGDPRGKMTRRDRRVARRMQ